MEAPGRALVAVRFFLFFFLTYSRGYGARKRCSGTYLPAYIYTYIYMVMRGLYLFLHALWIAFATAKFTQPVSSNDDFYQLWTEGKDEQGPTFFLFSLNNIINGSSVGDTIDITWDAGWSWGSGEQPKLVDLFVTWFDTPKKFSQLLLGMYTCSGYSRLAYESLRTWF